MRPQSQFDYEMVERDDLGDMPLPQRNGSYAPLPIPGSYAEASANEDCSKSNIRYRRIPQRVQDYQESRVSGPCLSIFSFLLTVHRLVYGNFVLDFAVSTTLLNMCSLRNEHEFTYMQYSAATCDPNDFNLASASYCTILRVEQCFSLCTMKTRTCSAVLCMADAFDEGIGKFGAVVSSCRMHRDCC